jgi:hypothetical protein
MALTDCDRDFLIVLSNGWQGYDSGVKRRRFEKGSWFEVDNLPARVKNPNFRVRRLYNADFLESKTERTGPDLEDFKVLYRLKNGKENI